MICIGFADPDPICSENPQKLGPVCKRNKRRRHTTSESSGDETSQRDGSVPESCYEGLSLATTPHRSSSGFEGEATDETEKLQRGEKRKQTQEENGVQTKQAHVELKEFQADCQIAPDTKWDRTAGKMDKMARQTHSTEHESSQQTGPRDRENNIGSGQENSDGPLKRKRSLQGEGDTKETKRVRINEEVQVQETPAENKKRKRNRHNKNVNKLKEQPELKVIPK